MKVKFIAMVFVVKWTLVFTPNQAPHQKIVRLLSTETPDRRAAQAFYDHRPKEGELFECQEHFTRKPGYCYVVGVQMSEEYRTEEYADGKNQKPR